jgi:hypothetical protein
MFILMCGCGWKKTTDLKDKNIHELKNDTMSSRKFRCPSCGKAVTPRHAKDPQSELDARIRSEKIAEDNRRWLADSLKAQEKFLKETDGGEEDQPE